MRIWGADGALQLDENSFTMRVVLSILVTFSGGTKTNQTFAVPGCNASNSVAVVLPNGDYSLANARQFETEMIEGVARVYNFNRAFADSYTASGTMRLFVIRFA